MYKLRWFFVEPALVDNFLVLRDWRRRMGRDHMVDFLCRVNSTDAKYLS